MASRVEPIAAVSPIAEMVLDTCGKLVSDKCCHNFLIDFNFTNQECLKLALSKGLGYGIIVASTMVKLPQVLKIFGAKSGAGITVIGTLFELLAITFNAAYSYNKRYPFAAWGEALFLLLETLSIALLVLWYDRKRGQATGLFLGYFSLLYVLMSGLTPMDLLWKFQASCLPLAVSGKMMQAYRNLQNGHTGQMSMITITLLFLGCVARIFTSIQETGDQLVVVTYVVASLANFVIVAQVLWYWKATNAFLTPKNKKKTN